MKENSKPFLRGCSGRWPAAPRSSRRKSPQGPPGGVAVAGASPRRVALGTVLGLEMNRDHLILSPTPGFTETVPAGRKRPDFRAILGGLGGRDAAGDSKAAQPPLPAVSVSR